MEKQKKIALINDLTGFGRCSTAVMAPIVSALRIQAVAVPTAILSAHTQFPTYYFDDYTDRMKDYIQTYKDLKLDFDAISTGFLRCTTTPKIPKRCMWRATAPFWGPRSSISVWPLCCWH